MKLNPLGLANASALSATILYLGCVLFLGVAPGLGYGIARSMAHGLNMSNLIPTTPPVFHMGGLLAGLASWAVFGWLLGLLVATFYNAMIKGK